MGLKDIIRKLVSEKEEDTVELPEEVEGEEEKQSVEVRIENLIDFVDVDRIMRFVKDGNIVFLKTNEIQKKDIGEFQTCVAKLKKVCNQFNFDIAGTEEGYIVLTPTFARIER